MKRLAILLAVAACSGGSGRDHDASSTSPDAPSFTVVDSGHGSSVDASAVPLEDGGSPPQDAHHLTDAGGDKDAASGPVPPACVAHSPAPCGGHFSDAAGGGAYYFCGTCGPGNVVCECPAQWSCEVQDASGACIQVR